HRPRLLRPAVPALRRDAPVAELRPPGALAPEPLAGDRRPRPIRRHPAADRHPGGVEAARRFTLGCTLSLITVEEEIMADQWGVDLVTILGAGVLAPDSCLSFDGTRLWFQRRGATMPESVAVSWIGGQFTA